MTREVQIEVIEGDWLTFSGVRINACPATPGKEIVLKAGNSEWRVPQGTVCLDAQGNPLSDNKRAPYSKETLWTNMVEPWKKFSEATGIGCMWVSGDAIRELRTP